MKAFLHWGTGVILALHGLIHLLGWPWWRPALMAVTLLSLVITVLDYGPAWAGIVVNPGRRFFIPPNRKRRTP